MTRSGSIVIDVISGPEEGTDVPASCVGVPPELYQPLILQPRFFGAVVVVYVVVSFTAFVWLSM